MVLGLERDLGQVVVELGLGFWVVPFYFFWMILKWNLVNVSS